MSTSSRFAVAVHILTSLALAEEERPVRSEELACSVNSHATVIRRLLSMLNSAKITKAQMGQGGGAMLAREASKITLLDIYQAVEEKTIFAAPRAEPNKKCEVGRHVLPVLECTMNRAQNALEAELAEVTIADVAKQVVLRGEYDCPCDPNKKD